jgi:hypothetical protein
MANEAREDAEAQELGRQMAVATDAIRAAVLQLLRQGEMHPQIIILAMARVTGELGASAGLAGGQDLEALLRELAAVVCEAGREHHEALQAIELLVAGSA